MMFDFIVNAEFLGATPNTSTVKSIPFDNNLLVAVFLAVFFTARFLNLIYHRVLHHQLCMKKPVPQIHRSASLLI